MENNSKNIRPYKDLSSRKISASSSISLSSLLVPLILIVVVILSTVFISLNQNKLQKEISDVNLRLSTMEKNQADLGETSQITLESLEQNLKDANFEIRKLWDLSNKRNRRNIETTMKSLETLLLPVTAQMKREDETPSNIPRKHRVKLMKHRPFGSEKRRHLAARSVDWITSRMDSYAVDCASSAGMETHSTIVRTMKMVNSWELCKLFI